MDATIHPSHVRLLEKWSRGYTSAASAEEGSSRRGELPKTLFSRKWGTVHNLCTGTGNWGNAQNRGFSGFSRFPVPGAEMCRFPSPRGGPYRPLFKINRLKRTEPGPEHFASRPERFMLRRVSIFGIFRTFCTFL